MSFGGQIGNSKDRAKLRNVNEGKFSIYSNGRAAASVRSQS